MRLYQRSQLAWYTMTADAMKPSYEIRSEAHGGHWVAWAARSGDPKPAGAVLLVGQTQQEAEANAARWVERLDSDPGLLRS